MKNLNVTYRDGSTYTIEVDTDKPFFVAGDGAVTVLNGPANLGGSVLAVFALHEVRSIVVTS